MYREMKQFEVLEWASSFLKSNHREENTATLLLQHHRQMDRTTFFQEMRATVPKDIIEAYQKDIEAHALTGVPIQHLIGFAPFYGEEFLVNEHVLIPRFETEELVERAAVYLESLTDQKEIVVVDAGTGSGVIGIILKRLFPEMTVYGTDISAQALEVAERNANRLGADVQFLQGDFLLPLLKRGICPDVLVSNPPYIDRSETDMLSDTVKKFDPDVALFADEKGLNAYRTILAQAAQFPQSALRAVFFEIGALQAGAVSEMVQAVYPSGGVDVIKDLAGRDRIVVKHIK